VPEPLAHKEGARDVRVRGDAFAQRVHDLGRQVVRLELVVDRYLVALGSRVLEELDLLLRPAEVRLSLLLATALGEEARSQLATGDDGLGIGVHRALDVLEPALVAGGEKARADGPLRLGVPRIPLEQLPPERQRFVREAEIGGEPCALAFVLV
jgi:hypothetical protein